LQDIAKRRRVGGDLGVSPVSLAVSRMLLPPTVPPLSSMLACPVNPAMPTSAVVVSVIGVALSMMVSASATVGSLTSI
jgi:hypothetical protein